MLGLIRLAALGSSNMDWLVDPGAAAVFPAVLRVTPAVAPYKKQGTMYTLSNGIIERTFFAGADGAFCTVEYRHLRSHQTFFRALAPEGNTTLNGSAYNIGGCAGCEVYISRT